MEPTSAAAPLLTPYKMGEFSLAHRVVLAPLTRCRAHGSLARPHMAVYYGQRATQGGLLISEACAVSEAARGARDGPGLWTDEQVESWRPVVDAVHAKGAVFFCQLWHAGRASRTELQPDGQAPVSSTDRRVPPQVSYAGDVVEFAAPRRLETEEIPSVVDEFRVAARNAIRAGFDGVEIHAANGYLIEQFMKDGVNDRTDAYGGGSLETRCRFLAEVTAEVAGAAGGAGRVGVRLSPFADYADCRDSDSAALALYVIRAVLNPLGVLYCHVVEPRMQADPDEGARTRLRHALWPLRRAFRGAAFVVNGGYDGEEGGAAVAEDYADLVAYGRLFLANPDLKERFRTKAPLNSYDRSTFYTSDPVLGYTDYPFLDNQVSSIPKASIQCYK